MPLTRTSRVLAAPFLLIACAPSGADPAHDPAITSAAFGDRITVAIDEDRFAGAIASLTFRGMEYVDTADHGRQIQSAIQLDGLGECDNPTEAGSRADANGDESSSRLLDASVSDNVLHTRTQAAYWLKPRENYHAACNPALPPPLNRLRRARNRTVLSGYAVSRRTAFYGQEIPNLLTVDVAWTAPENRQSANVEALTGYLPHAFSAFYTYDPAARALARVPATRHESPEQHTVLPVIIATPDGRHAMAAFSPAFLRDPAIGYMAWFDFAGGPTPTSKWSCVFNQPRIRSAETYRYRCMIAIGTLPEVTHAIDAYQH